MNVYTHLKAIIGYLRIWEAWIVEVELNNSISNVWQLTPAHPQQFSSSEHNESRLAG
ncbi:hypothetical protein CK203_096625 [Vitis vinifera]|uniref:Uncharacterized protein n=1 Tax=Vitis vinifera TaxID=29760 RepID=A0A438BR53_VITVI|nr:hypothetical protein CK203_096625 [Vitis vinifera]